MDDKQLDNLFSCFSSDEEDGNDNEDGTDSEVDDNEDEGESWSVKSEVPATPAKPKPGLCMCYIMCM